MAPLDRLKKQKKPIASIALLKISAGAQPEPPVDSMEQDNTEPVVEPVKPDVAKSKPVVSDATMKRDMAQHGADNATDKGEDTTEGGVHPAGTEPAPSGTLAGELQDLLDNVSGYYITAHQFHWNVVGPDFAEFHEFFENIYNDAWGSLDGLAESIRKLDQMVDIEFGEPDECNGVSGMLSCLSDMNTALIHQYKSTIKCADNEDEQGILNFLADRLDTHQKFQWQISSFQKSA